MKFNLQKLVLKNHPLFGGSFEVDFTDKNDFINNENIFDAPYATLIIGSNGTGKSLLLKEISDIFLYLKKAKEGGDSFTKYNGVYFEITYSIFGDNFNVKNFSFEDNKVKRLPITTTKNGKDTLTSELELPENIIVSSLLLNDKFTINKDYPDYYKYLGIRNIKTPSLAGTKNNIKKTLDLIYYNLGKNQTEIIYKIKSLLGFLEYDEAFRVNYKLRYKDYFFNQPLTIDRFDFLFQNFNIPNKGFSTRKDTEFIPFGVRYYKSNVEKNIKLKSEIVEFINYIREVLSNKLSFDILKSQMPLNNYALLSDLNSLDLISFPQINLERLEKKLDINEISSGEFHVLMSFIGIYASINQNSLILIDEPEISLHPNWQMKYISYLKEIFKDYQSCHFLITSHSHFFASDLDGRHSKIIGLKRDFENKIDLVELPKDINTYGWSAEDILYNVFDVLSTRNKFVAEDVAKILNELSNGKKDKNNKIKKNTFEKLKYLNENLKDNDPLKIVVKSLIKKIK